MADRKNTVMYTLMADRKNTVMYTLMAALFVPRIEQITGVKLTPNDVATLFGGAAIVWHIVATFIETRFPPKVMPVAPAEQKT